MPGELILATLQALVAGAAGVALWIAWRSATRGGDLWAARIVTAGFLLRAAAGMTLFWISYLRLPLMRSQYLGGGFWIFSLDSTYFMPLARAAGSMGPIALLTLDRGTWSSVSFLQVLSLAHFLFGYVPSVGVLLNCGCFLGGALLLRRWSASLGPAGRVPCLLALTVLSLRPSWILWATQPLKDPLFGLLVIAWFYASRHWFDSSAKPGAGWQRVLWGFVLAAVIYELAGMRAYFALILWLALGAGLVLSLLQASPVRRWQRLVTGALLWILLSQVVVASGGPLLPRTVRAFLTPYVLEPGATPPEPKATLQERVKTGLLRPLMEMRDGFILSGGASQIRGGTRAARPSAPRHGPPADLAPPPTAPEEWSSNLTTGLAATFLPHALGRSLGLFSIGSGRGAWAAVELDTLAFLLASVLGVLLTARAARRSGRISPLAVQALLSALLIAAGLAYVVTNFGTLFRLREMILLPLSLAPLAATLASEPARAIATARATA